MPQQDAGIDETGDGHGHRYGPRGSGNGVMVQIVVCLAEEGKEEWVENGCQAAEIEAPHESTRDAGGCCTNV